MRIVTIVCARCTLANHVSDRYCAACGLPMGSLQPDAGARQRRARALREPRARRSRRDAADRRIREANASRSQPVRSRMAACCSAAARSQASGLRRASRDRRRGRAMMGLVSVCGPVNDRDCRTLLKLNARIVDGHFAVRGLAGRRVLRRDRKPRGRRDRVDRRPEAGPARRRAGRRPRRSALARPRHLLMRRQIVPQVGGPIDRDRRVVGEPDRLQSIQIAEEARRAPRAKLQRRRYGEIRSFHSVEAGQARLVVHRIDHVDSVRRRRNEPGRYRRSSRRSCRGTQAARAGGERELRAPGPNRDSSPRGCGALLEGRPPGY